MEILRTPRAESFEIKLKGRMDAVWSDQVANALTDCVRAGHHVIAVDMAEVDYISSAGIRILVIHSRQLQAIQGRLAVTNASGPVREVLRLAGLHILLHLDETSPAVAKGAVEPPSREVALPQAGSSAQVFDLAPGGTLRVEWPGDPTPWLEGGVPPAAPQRIEFSEDAIGLGLGAFGSGDGAGGGCLGEFLAAGGAAVCQPADGLNRPDYMLLQGALTPAVRVAYGVVGRGVLARLLRFDKGAEQPVLPLSALVRTCLDAVESDAAGLVMVAETASLVGASLQKSPAVQAERHASQDIFAFPDVRDWVSFTAEPAFANSVSLIVGFASRGATAPNPGLLRPLTPSGELFGHFHAAAFPYRPIRKGRVDLAESVQALFESERVLGVLHLLNDWRDASGAGESQLLRGACWCAPLVT
jgi:anti-anti-sigma factor